MEKSDRVLKDIDLKIQELDLLIQDSDRRLTTISTAIPDKENDWRLFTRYMRTLWSRFKKTS